MSNHEEQNKMVSPLHAAHNEYFCVFTWAEHGLDLVNELLCH